MAKFLSQVATIIRGSVGGITFTATKDAPLVMRSRTAPKNSRTNSQTHIRSAFTGSAQAWKELSDADRALWNDYAASLTYSKPTGNYTPSGRQAFMSGYTLQTYLKYNIEPSLTLDDSPPILDGFLDIGNWSADAPAIAGTGFDLNGTYLGDEAIAIFYNISRKFDPTRNLYAGPWRKGDGAVELITGPAGINIPIDGLVDGGVYFVSIRGVVENGPARISNLMILRAVASVTAP